MAEEIGSLQYRILGDTTNLDTSLKQAEQKILDLKARVEKQVIGLKVDVSDINKQLAQSQNIIKPKIDLSGVKLELDSLFKIAPIKITLDTSQAQSQIAGLNALHISSTPETQQSKGFGVLPVPLQGGSSNSAGIAGASFAGSLAGDIIGGLVGGNIIKNAVKQPTTITSGPAIQPQNNSIPVTVTPNPSSPPMAWINPPGNPTGQLIQAPLPGGGVPPRRAVTNMGGNFNAPIGTPAEEIAHHNEFENRYDAHIDASKNNWRNSPHLQGNGLGFGPPIPSGQPFRFRGPNPISTTATHAAAAPGASGAGGTFTFNNATINAPGANINAGGAGGGNTGGGDDGGNTGGGGNPANPQPPKKGWWSTLGGVTKDVLTDPSTYLTGGAAAVAFASQVVGQKGSNQLSQLQNTSLDAGSVYRSMVEHPTGTAQNVVESIHNMPGGNLAYYGDLGGHWSRRQLNEAEVSNYEFGVQAQRQDTQGRQETAQTEAATLRMRQNPANIERSIRREHTAKISGFVQDINLQMAGWDAQIAKIDTQIGEHPQVKAGTDEAKLVEKLRQQKKTAQDAKDNLVTQKEDIMALTEQQKKEQIAVYKESYAAETQQRQGAILQQSLQSTDTLGSGLQGIKTKTDAAIAQAIINKDAVREQQAKDQGKAETETLKTQFGYGSTDIENSTRVQQLRNQGLGKRADIQAIRDQADQQLRQVQGNDPESVRRRQAIGQNSTALENRVQDDFAENLRKMSAAAKITGDGLLEFGGAAKSARDKIEEEFKAATYKKSPEEIKASTELKEKQLAVVAIQEAYGARQQELATTSQKNANEVRREQLRGNYVGAAAIEADLKGKERLAQIEAKHAAHGYRNEDEYKRELGVAQETNWLDKVEAARRTANHPAQSVGSFMGAFYIGQDPGKQPGPVQRKPLGPPVPPGLLPPPKALPPVKPHGPVLGPPSPFASAGGSKDALSDETIKILTDIARNTSKYQQLVAV